MWGSAEYFGQSVQHPPDFIGIAFIKDCLCISPGLHQFCAPEPAKVLRESGLTEAGHNGERANRNLFSADDLKNEHAFGIGHCCEEI
jgi:hypothetical protein